MITSNDWKIYKRLNESRTVYIIPARGCDKPYAQLELYSQLLFGGRKIAIKLDEGWDYILPAKDYSYDYSKLESSILD